MKIRLGTRLLDDKILKINSDAISCRELFLQTELSLASITREIQSGSESLYLDPNLLYLQHRQF